MLSSLMEALAEDLLDAMHFGCDVAGGEPGDVADRRGIQAFEVEENDLSIERRERMYQGEDAVQQTLLIDVLLGTAFGRPRRELVEADERRRARTAPEDQ